MRKKVIPGLCMLAVVAVLMGAFAIPQLGQHKESERQEAVRKIAAVTIQSETDAQDGKDFSSCVLLVNATCNVKDKNAISRVAYGDVYVFTYATAEETKEAYERFLVMDAVTFVEADAVIYASDGVTADALHDVKTEKTNLGRYLEKLTPQKEVVAAILDTGLDRADFPYPDRIVDGGLNFTAEGEKDETHDGHGHGTAMAELVAEGSGEMVSILPIKIADDRGRATLLSAYAGMLEAVNKGADVILLSMNTVDSSSCQLLGQTIREVEKQGIRVVLSAGNANFDTAYIAPSNVEAACVVSAVTDDLKAADYSNYGDSVDYSAYGRYVDRDGTSKEGTSYAAARVAGMIAGLLSCGEEPGSVLDSYVLDLGEEGDDLFYGKGALITERYLTDGMQRYFGNALKAEGSSVTDYNLGADLMELDWEGLSGEELDRYFAETGEVYVGMFLSSLTEEEITLLQTKSVLVNRDVTVYHMKEGDNADTLVVSETEEVNFMEHCVQLYEENKEVLTVSESESSELSADMMSGGGHFYLASEDQKVIYRYTFTGFQDEADFFGPTLDEEITGVFNPDNIKVSGVCIVQGTGFAEPKFVSATRYLASVRTFWTDINYTDTSNGDSDPDPDAYYELIDLGADDAQGYYGLSLNFTGFEYTKKGHHLDEEYVQIYRPFSKDPAMSYNLERIVTDEEGNVSLEIQDYHDNPIANPYPEGIATEQKRYASYRKLREATMKVYYNGVYAEGCNHLDAYAYDGVEGNPALADFADATIAAKLSTGASTLNATDGKFVMNVDPAMSLGIRWRDPKENRVLYHSDIPMFVFQMIPNEYVVRFDPGTGEGSIPDLKVTYGKGTYSLPLVGDKMYKIGCRFKGWVVKDAVECDIEEMSDGELITKDLTTENYDPVTGAGVVTLVADWDIDPEKSNFIIKYLGNGETSGEMEDQPAAINTNITLSANKFKREFVVTYNANDGGEFAYGIGKEEKDYVSSTFEGWMDENLFQYEGVVWESHTFNAAVYSNLYENIANACKAATGSYYDKQWLVKHYMDNIIAWNNTGNWYASSDVFNVADYVKYNEDVRNQYSSLPQYFYAAAHHWDEWGYTSGLRGIENPWTDATSSRTGKYCNVYPDKAVVRNLVYEKVHEVGLKARWTDKEVALPTEDDVSKEGYELIGWSRDKTATEPEYAPGEKVLVSQDMTFFAVWSGIGVDYTVRHYLVSASGQKTLKATETHTGYHGDKISSVIHKKTYTDYVYSYTLINGIKGIHVILAYDNEYTIDLYYVEKEYMVTLDAGNGIASVSGSSTSGEKINTDSNGTMGEGSFAYGETISVSATPKSGYKFLNWEGDWDEEDWDRDNVITTGAFSFSMPKLDIELIAYGAPIAYTIIYELDGGTLPAGKTNPTTYNVETATFTLNNPTKEGYVFAGWSGTGITAGTSKITVTVPKGSMGNRSYTANWESAYGPVYTRQMSISSGDNVYAAAAADTYYVKSDGVTPFTLSYDSYIDGAAFDNYQIDCQMFDVDVPIPGKSQKLYTTLPYTSPLGNTDALDASLFVREYDGDDVLTDASDTGAYRYNMAKENHFYQAFAIPDSFHGRTVVVVPRVSASYNGGADKNSSPWADDETHAITLIADGEAPEILGVEVLEALTHIGPADAPLELTLLATDACSGVKDLTVKITNTDNHMEQELVAEEDCITLMLTTENPLFAGDVNIEITAVDNVGNIRLLTYQLGGIILEAFVERILEPHTPVFRKGESGILTIRAAGYVERLEIEFPEQLLVGNPSLQASYTYETNTVYRKEEAQQFMIPLSMDAGEAYEIIVRAYKGEACKTSYPQFAVLEGTVLDDIRTRLR